MGIKQIFVQLMPQFLVGFFARPYIGGYTMEAALDVAQQIHIQQGLTSTIDLLGEEVSSPKKASQNCELYLRLIDATAALNQKNSGLEATISLKLSSLTVVESPQPVLELDRKMLDDNMKIILDRARDKGVDLTIDMEDQYWTDLTLEVYSQTLKDGYSTVGTVLQTRLHRTEADVDALDSSARIRLCIGIYPEPASVALTRKSEMKERMLTLGKKLLEKGVYTEFATHDELLIQRFYDEIIIPGGYTPQQFEVQMLLGVPRNHLQTQITKGDYRSSVDPVKMRLYVPFAENKADAVTYCKRRLVGNPSMMIYGLRNVLGKLIGK